nr:catalase family peroxidase [uncultured Rhodopila sp.]
MTPSRLFAAAAVTMCLGCPATGALAQGLSTATQTIDVMNTLWGKHAGTRANHAKGVVVEGSFSATPAAAALSKATIFSGQPVQVTVRFSDSTGLPALPDGSPDANPHGMSIKFYDANGDVDVVTNSLAFFPVATGEDFLALLQALAASGPDAPKPTKADQFLATHPSVGKAFGTVATPASFARETYNGVDAFIFVSAEGKRQPFRFQFVPVAGTEHLTPEEAAKQPPDFLVDELPKRLATQAVAFHMVAQLADPEDQTRDPTKPWPADRKRVEMGTMVLTRAASDNVRAQRELHFLPNRLMPGIEVSDDPLIDARVRAYVISFGRRAH